MGKASSWGLLAIVAQALWAAVFLNACTSQAQRARLETAEYARRFEESRKGTDGLEYPELLARLGVKATTDQGLPFDPTKVRYFAEAAKALGLVEDEKRAFQKNGFVMVDHGGSLSMGRAYLEVYKADLPVFVSTDSILHALHRSFDGVLKDIEWSVLVPNLQAALAAIEPELCPLARVPGLQESVDDLALFLAVARNLLAGVKPEAQAQLIFPPTCGDPEAVREVLDKISRLRPDQREQPSTVYGGARVIDWSQFRPRGHYAQITVLEAYFRTMMWLGRADLAWALDRERELRSAGLLSLLVQRSHQSSRLAAMSRLLDFLVGHADSSGLAEMEEALNLARIRQPADLASSDHLARLRVAMGKVGPTQQIRSELIPTSPLKREATLPPAVFQLFGQRFVVDAFVLSKMVYDSITFRGTKPRRGMPSGLDVMAALGSHEAVVQLEPQIRQFNYAANLLAARQLLDSLPRTEWQHDIYVRWLDSLRQLVPQPNSEHFPQVMRSREWQRKQLQTMLASWAELRHDTILYAKQSSSGEIVCEYPEGYVEPYPAFYAVLKDLARAAPDVLGDPDLHPTDIKLPNGARQVQQEQRGFWDYFARTMDQLERIAVKELRAEPLDANERKLLKDVIVEHLHAGCGGIGPNTSYTGWYERLHYQGGSTKREPTVADVHTDPSSGLVLEEGVGNARYLVIAIESQQSRAAYVGPAYSYYEFTSPTRLTDEEWAQMIGNVPPPPFTAGFVVPPTKRSMIYPPKPPAPPAPLEPTE